MNSSEKNNSNSKQSADYYNSIDLAKQKRKNNPFNTDHPGNLLRILLVHSVSGYAILVWRDWLRISNWEKTKQVENPKSRNIKLPQKFKQGWNKAKQ